MFSENFIKKRLHYRFFSVNIAKFLRTPILKNICELLLLNIAAFYAFTPNTSYVMVKLPLNVTKLNFNLL